MRIQIDLEVPDDFIGRNIWIFAGMDPVARRFALGEHAGKWQVKTHSCSRSGACCARIGPDHPLNEGSGRTEMGCQYLMDDGSGERMCGLTIFRPHGCAIADGHQIGVEDCSVKWKVIE